MVDARALDLTAVMAPYFDPHMVSPLLDFAREVNLYESRDITVQKIKVVQCTNMIELIEDEYLRFPEDAGLQEEFKSLMPKFEQRKNDIFDQLDHPTEEIVNVSTFFQNEALIAELKSGGDLNLDFIAANHDIPVESMVNYFKYAKFHYECGMYETAEKMLANYLSVTTQAQNPACYTAAVWGRLACFIVLADWDHCKECLKSVRDSYEIRNITAMDQMRQRSWLMHWGLFVHLNQRDGFDTLIDFFTERHYLQTIENITPWLMRYYVAAVILSPRRKNLMKDVLAEINHISYSYVDPVLEFVVAMYEQFDFDAAHQKLKECVVLMNNDFFLRPYVDKFLEESRILMCDVYCTIHRRVDLAVLAKILEVDEDQVEKWVVNMVRSSSGLLDAKIDSAGKQLVMAAPLRSAHQQVIDRTKELTGRSALLASNLDNLIQDQGPMLKQLIKK